MRIHNLLYIWEADFSGLSQFHHAHQLNHRIFELHEEKCFSGIFEYLSGPRVGCQVTRTVARRREMSKSVEDGAAIGQ
jgi:hypothetical protein